MRILVVSDTHGNIGAYESALEAAGEVDLVLHCGDVCMDERVLARMTQARFLAVRGNMDFGGPLKDELLLEEAGHTIFVTHGHRHYVKFGTDELKADAIAQGADIALYGHTHVPDLEISPEIIVMNPGSAAYPRTMDRTGSFGIIDIGEDGKVDCRIEKIS